MFYGLFARGEVQDWAVDGTTEKQEHCDVDGTTKQQGHCNVDGTTKQLEDGAGVQNCSVDGATQQQKDYDVDGTTEQQQTSIKEQSLDSSHLATSGKLYLHIVANT